MPLDAARALAARISSLGVRPGDDEDERLRKGVLTWYSLMVGIGAPIDGVPALLVGEHVRASLAIGNGVLMLLGLVHLAITGERGFVQRVGLSLVLLVPAISAVLMGGFVASDGVLLWSAMAPVGAMLLCARREMHAWAAAYLAIAAGVLVWEGLTTSLATDRLFARLGLVLGFPAMVMVLAQYFMSAREQARDALAAEHARAEHLLLNVLPAPIAERLKQDEATIADAFSGVSVVFADIVGFTVLSSHTPPDALVAILDTVFARFDALADRHGVEKIKTIGDAYMVAAGLPEPRADHAAAAAAMALDMREALAALNAELGTSLGVRIGVHSGPVVAGVIGRRKFSYDLWGDTVNTASRMESHGVEGEVQISEATRDALGDAFAVEERGVVEVKGKGAMRVYLLRGRVG